MESIAPSSLKGQFLVAMPRLPDPSFHKTVICVLESTAEGAFGITINRVYPEASGKSIFEGLGIDHVPDTESTPIHWGGPVEPNGLFILHGPPVEWESCSVVAPSLALSFSRDILEAIAANRGPKDYLISRGCAVWAPGQLDREMRWNSWLTCDIVEDIVFRTPIALRWEKAVEGMGIDPVSLSDTAGHA